MPPNKTRTRSEWLARNQARALKKNEVSGKSVTLPVEIKNPENKVKQWLNESCIKPLFENHENEMYMKENIDPLDVHSANDNNVIPVLSDYKDDVPRYNQEAEVVTETPFCKIGIGKEAIGTRYRDR